MEEFEYQQESNAKKYAIIGVSVGLILLMVGIGIFVIVKRRAALNGEVSGTPTGTVPSVNGVPGTTPEGTTKGETGQLEAPVSNVTPIVSNDPVEGAPADGVVTPPPTVDPRTNRLLTDKEKELAGYPLSWDVRVQAMTSSVGTVFLNYTVEKKPLDQDNDGLSDQEEREAGTDPTKADTDGDGLSDRQEVQDYKTDPTKPDSDGDGASDANEVMGKTDPSSKTSN